MRIGILLDVEKKASAQYIRTLETEISNLLKTKYTVKIAASDILPCDWSVDCIKENYNKLVSDRDIDIIIGVGVLNSSVLTRQTSYPKPVIVVGVIDPALQQIPITPGLTSGKHNLTYLMMPQTLEADLETFHGLYPFKEIALVEDRRLLEVMGRKDYLKNILMKKGVTMLEVPVDSVDATLDGLSQKVDAVIIGSLYRFEDEDRARLIDKINAQNLPTFAVMGASDLQLGALAATRPATDMLRILRRVALNVERVLEGEDPAKLPLALDREADLYVNMHTARQIGFSPPWDVLLEAELVNTVSPGVGRVIGLRDSIAEALSANKTLLAQQQAFQSKQADVALARTQLYPQVGVSAGGAVIDDKHALNGQAEKTTSGAASLDQVIFSEQFFANVTVNKYQRNASQYRLNQTELDTVLQTGTAYLDILRANTNRRIRKEYLDLVKKNLAIAKKRLRVGYAGAADVYRWESERASAMNSLIEAHATVLYAKQRLNQLLYRPIDEELEVSDVTLSDDLFKIYPEADFREYLRNPAAMGTFTDFLVKEAQATLPEIKEIDEAIKANERVLLSYKRKRYLPDVRLNSQASHSFSRWGAGSEIPLPDDDAWQVGVNASWPLFLGGEIHTRRRQLGIDIAGLKAQKADLVHTLDLNLRDSVIDIVSKSFNITLSTQAAEAGAKSLELVQDSYEKGLVSIVQLLDAQNAALTAELAAANAIYVYFISYLNLERAVGRYLMLSAPEVQQDFFNRFLKYDNEKKQ